MGGKGSVLSSASTCFSCHDISDIKHSPVPCSDTQYIGKDVRDEEYNSEVKSAHEPVNAGCLSYIPFQMHESKLQRADGHKLKTDWRTIADEDGDQNVSAAEVIRAVFMLHQGREAQYEHAGGELLFPEIDDEDVDRSALEIMLRNQIKVLDDELEKVLIKVKAHREELEDDHARETHDYLLLKAAHIAKEATDMGVLLCSDDREGHRAIQQQMVELAQGANALANRLAMDDNAEVPACAAKLRQVEAWVDNMEKHDVEALVHEHKHVAGRSNEKMATSMKSPFALLSKATS